MRALALPVNARISTCARSKPSTPMGIAIGKRLQEQLLPSLLTTRQLQVTARQECLLGYPRETVSIDALQFCPCVCA